MVKQKKARPKAHADSGSAGEDIVDHIRSLFDELPAEAKKAARYVTGHRSEVAFQSMRSVARSADVSPATMLRLAKALGFDGYEPLRQAFQAQFETRPQSFLGRAQLVRAAQTRSRWMDGVQRLVDSELSNIRACVDALDERDLEKVAGMFAGARRVYVIGLRGMYPAAFFFHYSAKTFSENTVLVDGSGATHLDAIRGITPRDVVIVFTCQPYAKETLRGARFAHARGAKLIAVTDGALSPAARLASVVFKVDPNASSLLSSAAANMLMSQVLAAVFFAATGKAAVENIRRTDEQVDLFEVYERD
ncbi:MAG TPA: MurR/RpiR family transcriptional regulator [Burkholderiales bacterium]|nr:MurR/RpiR family transcriptional regulator [Burkholderiales bacterium]